MDCTVLPLLTLIFSFYRLWKLWKLAIICCMTEQLRDGDLFLVWHHKLLCTHVYKDLLWCKSVSDFKPEKDPCPLLAWSCNIWWLDLSFTSYKKVNLYFKKVQCISNRHKDVFRWKNILVVGALKPPWLDVPQNFQLRKGKDSLTQQMAGNAE